MSKILEYLILMGLIVSAVVAVWSVLALNHLNIGRKNFFKVAF